MFTLDAVLMAQLSLLIPSHKLTDLVKSWLEEDIPSFDYGGIVVGDSHEEAVLLCKSSGVLAGVPFFNAVFDYLGCTVTWHCPEGSALTPVCQVAKVTGKACSLLAGERTALNCLARASGIATEARQMTQNAKKDWGGQIVGTRKTTPGFRLVEKYAILVGGAGTHRYDLSSMVMLKDNHIWAAGDVTKAVEQARSVAGFSLKIEVECRSLAEAEEATAAGSDVIMFDNFKPEALHHVAMKLKTSFPGVLVEASGGITRDNVHEYAGPHVDIISSSKLTQGYSTVDFSLKLMKEGHDPRNLQVDHLE